MKDTDSLAHTTWNCKYHIVFAPKYRRKVIYGKIRVDIGKIMRMLCARKGIEIIEAECCPDHIHMLVKIPPKYSKKRCKNCRSRSMPGSHTYVSRDSTKHKCVRFRRVFKRKKYANDI